MRQALWMHLAAVSVGLAFLVVAGLVWLTGARLPSLVRVKLLLGALLVGLGVGASGCDSDPVVACYSPVYEPPPAPPRQVTVPEPRQDQDRSDRARRDEERSIRAHEDRPGRRAGLDE